MHELLIYGNFIAVLSIVAAGCAIYLAFVDRKAAAITMGGLFVATAIVSQLQSFKSFKAFTVEAQLQDRIDRADELIKQLRELSILVAKAGYGSTGISMLALGGLQTSEITLTKDFERLLERLHLSNAEMQDARRPLLRVVGLKITSYMSNISSNVVGLKTTDENRGKNLEGPTFTITPETLQQRIFTIDTPAQMRSVLEMTLPSGMTDDQKAAADQYISKLVKIYEDCQSSGALTPEFLALDKQTSTPSNSPDIAKAIFEGRAPG